MIPTTVERLLASLLLFAAFIALAKAVGFVKERRTRKSPPLRTLPAGLKADEPALLYFWSAGCSQCTPQERQIEHARSMLEQAGMPLTVLKVNALEDHPLSKLMNIMTVPTTVLLDARGNVTAWNPGLTPWRTIVDQFHTIR